jgi:hypothetical protein
MKKIAALSIARTTAPKTLYKKYKKNKNTKIQEIQKYKKYKIMPSALREKLWFS